MLTPSICRFPEGKRAVCARVRGGTGRCPPRLGASQPEGLSRGPEKAGLTLVKQPSEARLPAGSGLIGAEGTGT